jgi:prepilin signal peptidase PulO-like enzyme (type II secretory pathway)
MGSAFGSFMNVVIDRAPARQSIVRPGSRCPSCRTSLKPLDLVPVASYLWLRGKCRHCGARIPVRLLLVETGAGLAFLLAYLVSGLDLGLLLLLGAAGVLATAGIAVALRGR